MKITAQEEYGLRCLLRLAQAEGESLAIPEIAAAEGLSGPYVAKLLSVLRQTGVIESERGRAGGYRLARPAAEIGLGTVLMSLGEPLFDDPGYCQRHKGSETEAVCVHIGGCSLRGLWQTLEFWMRHLLDQISLADLLQNERGISELIRTRLSAALGESLNDSPAPLTPLTLMKD
jgi:Rrf2 family iron-sulfur cluster assembly transcriptional regulator